MKRVHILGAGLSKAISSEMPMTDALGQGIASRLKQHWPADAPTSFNNGRFEAWLSRLAEPQPDLDSATNEQNHALFLRISNALREELVDAQNRAFAQGPPLWLSRLVGAWQALDTTVITFNYDTLIERTIDFVCHCDWGPASSSLTPRIYAVHATRNLPATPVREGLTATHERAKCFRLLKLHGSIDNFWVPGDGSGASINRYDGGGQWRSPREDDPETRGLELPGREPFIVPPAAAKSSFYTNPLTRQLWQTARQALEEADEIALVGYSLPVTDLVFGGLLSEVFRANTAVRVRIYNPNPEVPAEQLRALGLTEDRMQIGDNSLDCVDVLASELERSVWFSDSDDTWRPSIAGLDPEIHVAVNAYQSRPAFSVRPGSESAVVVGAGNVSTTAAVGAPGTLRTEELLRAAGNRFKIAIAFPDGTQSYAMRAVPSSTRITLVPAVMGPPGPLPGA